MLLDSAMQHYGIYRNVSEDEIDDLVTTIPYCTLISQSKLNEIHIGIFNPIKVDGDFYLHLNKKDEQVKDLVEVPRAKLIFHEFLATIPSHWVDEKYGGAATSYYRYAEFSGSAEVTLDAEKMVEKLTPMMKHFQPEGGYEPLSASSPTYKQSWDMLALVRIHSYSVRAKWKMGQNRPVSTRLKVAAHLRERNQGLDRKASELIEQMCKHQ